MKSFLLGWNLKPKEINKNAHNAENNLSRVGTWLEATKTVANTLESIFAMNTWHKSESPFHGKLYNPSIFEDTQSAEKLTFR